MVVVAFAGDTMLGRGVARAIVAGGARSVLAPEVAGIAREADVVISNLECCISARGAPWPRAGKPFFFRAPPEAVEVLQALGVDCVTLANNHALDYGVDALADTRRLLHEAGIAAIGAGGDVGEARAPWTARRAGVALAVVAVTDHPPDFAAATDRAGVAYADLHDGTPGWLVAQVGELRARADVVIVTPHWGPNMVATPVPHVRRAARELRGAGATLVAGHSAHVFHGVADGVLFDLGDFLDDYATNTSLRNDLGLLWLVELDADGLVGVHAVPLKLDFCHTRLATGDDARWTRARLAAACAQLGTSVREEDGRLAVFVT